MLRIMSVLETKSKFTNLFSTKNFQLLPYTHIHKCIQTSQLCSLHLQAIFYEVLSVNWQYSEPSLTQPSMGLEECVRVGSDYIVW